MLFSILFYASLAFRICSVAAVQNIKVQGSDFVNNATNQRFQIIGVAYQPGGSQGFGMGSDPLSNGTLCLRDAALMQALGVNAIRIYNLDPSLNHDLCASIFNAVGIYMILDVNSPLPNQSLNPGDLSSSYNTEYLSHIFSVVEAFHDYPNVLGFFAGNEVMNDVPSGGTVPPYLRAVTRDLNAYIAQHSPRKIPVGYSAADVKEILVDSWSYLSCDINGDPNDASRIAFFGLNSYSWCGPTSPSANYKASSYGQLIDEFGNTTIPLFFSEYGCNKVEPRVFDEVAVLYGNMTSVMSGGLVYEYYQETNDYGLVSSYDNGTAQLRVDYNNLQKQYNKLDIKALESGNSSATMIKAPKCGSNLISSKQFSTKFTIPSIPSDAMSLISKGVPNAKTGKIVSVTTTAVTLPVYDSAGNEIKNLAIKPLPEDQSNTPNGANTTGSSTAGASKPSATKKSAGTQLVCTPEIALVLVIAVLCFL